MSEYIVIKPWGKEHWLADNPCYLYKRLYIDRGHRTSLQYHNFKLETNYLIRGNAILEIGTDKDNLEKREITQDDYFTIEPGVIHRITAVTDIILQEVSTPHADDVIRLEDDTSRTNGKIEHEHEQH
jgi:mannose-6-phosphate isomerase